MAEGDRECIGGVIGLGDVFETEEFLDHQLHLGLVSAAVIGEGLFDLEWGVLGDTKREVLECQEDDTSRFGNGNGSFLIIEKEERLNRSPIRTIFLDNRHEVITDFLEPGRHGEGLARRDMPIGHHFWLPFGLLYDTPSDRRRTRVNPKNFHRSSQSLLNWSELPESLEEFALIPGEDGVMDFDEVVWAHSSLNHNKVLPRHPEA